jgi:hypothetical protein
MFICENENEINVNEIVIEKNVKNSLKNASFQTKYNRRKRNLQRSMQALSREKLNV